MLEANFSLPRSGLRRPHGRVPVARRACGPLPCSPRKRCLLAFSFSRGARTFCRLPLMRLRIAGAAAMAGLSPLATCLCCEFRILREAAFLIRHALPALAASDRGKLAILRETTLRARDALSALTAGLCSQATVLREAALLIRNRFTSHACDLALTFRVHRCESTVRRAPILSWFVSHRYSPPQ